MVAKTSSGEGRVQRSKGLIATDIGLRLFYCLLNAKDVDGIDKWEGDTAVFVLSHSSKVLRNTMVSVVPECTPEDSHAAYPTDMGVFINKMTESEISCIV